MNLIQKALNKIRQFFRSDFEKSVRSAAKLLKDNGTVPPADWSSFEAGIEFALSQYIEDRKNTRLLMSRIKNRYLDLYGFIQYRIENSMPQDALVYVNIMVLLEKELDALIEALE